MRKIPISRLALFSQICYYFGMKISNSAKKYSGFTLIELIVVIMILATLAGIAYPAIMGFMENGRIATANKVCSDIVAGVEQFKQDNNGILPYYPNRMKPDRDDQVYLITLPNKEAGLLGILTGYEDSGERLNTTGEAYIKPTKVESPIDGLYGESNDELGLYDPWGQPYYIVLSESTQGSIDPFTGKRVRNVTSLVYSIGPDKEGIAPAHLGKGKKSGNKKKMNKAQKADAEAEAKEAISDNVYSWKKTANK